MSVKFNVIARHNPLHPGDARKFYATIKSDGETTLKQLSKRVSNMSTVNSADVLAVLDTLLQAMQEELLDGKIIRFGDFGSFAITLKSEGREKETDVSGTSIKGARLNFKPGKDIRDTLRILEFHKA